MPPRQAVEGHQHRQVGAAEIRIQGRRAEQFGTTAQIAADQRRRLDVEIVAQRIEGERMQWSHAALGRRQMQRRKLVPEAS